MLYFVTYPDWEGHWHKFYNAAVESEMRRRGIRHCRFTTDYASSGVVHVLEELASIESRPDDRWLFSVAQNPAIELVEQRPGKKFGHVHGTECFPFEPSLLQGMSLEESRRFGYYDRLFFSSDWARTSAARAYPQYADRFLLTGFPVDYEQYDPHRGGTRCADLVVFNQRLSCERLPPLEIEFSRQLLARGYRVWHLYPEMNGDLPAACPHSENLMAIGRASGMRFVANASKRQYLRRLARATTVVTTSICDALPVGIIEAVYLGVVPVVPDAMCFGEFIHPDNRYRPYDMSHMLEIVRGRPRRRHEIGQYGKRRVLDRYARAMF